MILSMEFEKTSLDSDVFLPANANIDVKKHDGSKSKAIASSYDGVRDVTLVTPGEAFAFTDGQHGERIVDRKLMPRAQRAQPEPSRASP